MRKTIMNLIVVVGISINAYGAEPEGCRWKDQIIAPGKSVYVRDPVLVSMQYHWLVVRGMKPSKAKSYAPKTDWVGYVLVCTRSFEPGPSVGRQGDIIAPTGYVMTLIELQQQGFWVQQVQN